MSGGTSQLPDSISFGQTMLGNMPGALAYLAEQAGNYLGSGQFLNDLAIVGGVLFVDHMWSDNGKSALSRMLKFSISARTDLLCFALTSTMLMGFLIMLLSFQVGLLVQIWLKNYMPVNFLHRIENPWLQVLVFFIVLDFLNYWRHRFSHEIGWWWQLHKYHHSADDLTVFTSYRLHPADMAVAEFFIAFPAALMGIPLVDLLVYRSLVLLQGLFHHSNMRWTLGPIGYLLISPWAHRVHHSLLEEHQDRNYGGIFSIWDRLFGSWYSGSRINEDDELGLVDNPFNKRGVLYDFFLPFQLLWQTVRKKFRTRTA